MSLRELGSRSWRFAPFAYLFVIAMAAAGVHIAQYTEFSPIDELRHVDYAMRASRFDFPNLGDRLSQSAMREEACRGIDLPGANEPPCRTERFKAVDFRDDGYQTATAHPPTYYLGSGWFARAATALGVSNSFLDPARILSALLLAAGLMVAFAAGRMAGVRAAPLLAALTLLPVMPSVLHAASTVNPDSTAILVGAIVMLVALGWERGRFPIWTLAVAGVVAAGTKYTSLLSVVIVGGLFVVRACPFELWRPRWAAKSAGSEDSEPTDAMVMTAALRETIITAPDVEIPARSRSDYLKAAAMLVGPAVLVAGAWATVERVRATIDPMQVPQNQVFKATGIPRPGIVFAPSNVFAWLPPHDGYDPFRFVTPYVQDVRILTVALFAGTVLVAALRVNRRDTMSMFGALCVGAALLGGPAFVVITAVISNIVVGPAARYGMSLLPFVAAVLASSVKGQVATVSLWLFALLSISIVVGAMVVSSPA